MDIFEQSKPHMQFRNMVDDPMLRKMALRNQGKRDFCACGFNATGEEELPPEEEAPVKTNVMNLQAWKYAKSALALVGAYAVIMFLYKKFGK
jgi:hypothetical protein